MSDHVYLLEIEIKSDGEFWDGRVAVYSTFDGAVIALDNWLSSNGIDRASAHFGEVRTDTSLCNDFIDGYEDDADTVSWGINKMVVR